MGIAAAPAEIREIVKLRCSVKNYGWGMGKESCVGRLYGNNSGEGAVDDELYAEFWMGTHESGPSYAVFPAEVVNGGFSNEKQVNKLVSLKDWIDQNPSVLGDKVFRKWGSNLPFLFKVIDTT